MPIPQTFNADDLEKVFKTFKDELQNSDLSEAFRESGDELRKGFDANVGAKVDSDGKPWAPHAPETVRRYGPHPLLVLSYDMLAALTEENAKGNLTTTEARSAEFGINHDVIEYARTHQYGDSSRNIPKREYLYATDEVEEKITSTFADWTFEIVVGS